MAKDGVFIMRIDSAFKAKAEAAAKEDHLSLAAYIQQLVAEDLRRRAAAAKRGKK